MTRTKPRSSHLQNFGVITIAIFEETWGKRICGRFQSINAQAEQERSELGGTGDYPGIQKHHNGYHSQWWSANTWGSNSIRSRSGALRDGNFPQRHACSPVVRETLQRTRLPFEWTIGQKQHLTNKFQKNPMQHGELCADCCPRMIDRFLQLECKYVFYIVTAGHISWATTRSGSRSRDPTKSKTQIKTGTSFRHREAGCEISPSVWRG